MLIFTELTLFVERSLGCFAFIKYKKRRVFFFHEREYRFCHSFIGQHHKRQTAEIYQMLDADPFAEQVILPPFWILSVYVFYGIKHTRREKKAKKRYKMMEQSMFAPLHGWKCMEQ